MLCCLCVVHLVGLLGFHRNERFLPFILTTKGWSSCFSINLLTCFVILVDFVLLVFVFIWLFLSGLGVIAIL
jgi:hypothetical protein